MRLFIACALSVLLVSCTSTSTSTGTLTPIQQVGCDIETAINSSFSSAVATALTCTNPAAIQASLATAFANINLCTGQVASATAAQLAAAKVKALVHPNGVIGNIACPLAVSGALGYLSNAIPTSWGCSATASASTLSATLTTLCESAVPI